MWYKNIAGGFFGIVTKHACDGRKNGQTDRITTPKTALALLRRAVKTEMLRRNGPVIKSWSQSWGQPRKGVYMAGKICERGRSCAGSERWSYGWWEWCIDMEVNMNRQVRGRGTGMRLTERTRKLIPERCSKRRIRRRCNQVKTCDFCCELSR